MHPDTPGNNGVVQPKSLSSRPIHVYVAFDGVLQQLWRRGIALQPPVLPGHATHLERRIEADLPHDQQIIGIPRR